jgi:aryl-alcohol dehydrogenase-like predicted oxidoreductase
VEYVRITGVPCPAARIVLGTASLGGPLPFEGSRTGARRKVFDFLSEILDSGGNTFDTARIYGLGQSERILGEWMTAAGTRDRVVIITKGGHPSLLTFRSRMRSRAIEHDVEQSLRALRTDRVDLWLLHRDDPRVPVSVIMEMLHSLRERGSIRAFGASNWSHERVREANEFASAQGIPGLAMSSPQFSLAEWRRAPFPGCVSVSGPQGKEARAWYSVSGVPLLAWSSLAAGFFASPRAGKPHRSPAAYRAKDNEGRLHRAQDLAESKGVTVSQVALAYLLQQPLQVFPVVSTHRASRYRENAGALAVRLTPSELSWLESGGPF